MQKHRQSYRNNSGEIHNFIRIITIINQTRDQHDKDHRSKKANGRAHKDEFTKFLAPFGEFWAILGPSWGPRRSPKYNRLS